MDGTTVNDLPRAPGLRRMLGPSLVLLGLGLGSGELILWPYLSTNFGLGIIWAAVLGILFQFFVNMEIERYSIIKGESIFVGYSRLSRFAPFWFIGSTFISWVWPGLIASSAKILSVLFNFERFDYLAIGLLLLIGVILSVGPSVYKTIENFQKIVIGLGVPLIILITVLVAKYADWQALLNGLAGHGNGYSFFPAGIPLLTFLGAFAFAGAGGNLNLTQSFYIKEKGYGMCKDKKGIGSVLTGNANEIELEGETFAQTPENIKRFQTWWKLVNIENFIVFFVTGALTIILLSLLAYSATRGFITNAEGIKFIANEAEQISLKLAPFFGALFLTICGVMLFGTQLTILDSTSRIISENVVIVKKKTNLTKTYYLILWSQITVSILIFLVGFNDPKTLIVTCGVINALAMFVHIGATHLLNKKSLPKSLQISSWRTAILAVIWSFFGAFAVYSIASALF